MFRAVMRLKKHSTIAEHLTLPAETFSDISLVEVRGRRSVTIENHRGILEYTDTRVCIAVKQGTVCIVGAGLRIARMTRRRLEVRGSVQLLELE